jgi:hypothetical protein
MSRAQSNPSIKELSNLNFSRQHSDLSNIEESVSESKITKYEPVKDSKINGPSEVKR